MQSDKFRIALIGRTNVGKSTLFNRILGKRSALVFDRNGVTRDSKEGDAEIWGKKVSLIDTPGMFDYAECDQNPELMQAISTKVKEVIDSANIILFVIDGVLGITEYDREIANILRKTGKTIIVVVNKSEKKVSQLMYIEAVEFGFGDVISISAEHSIGIDSLYETIFPLITETNDEIADNENTIKLTFIGRPNVGKSTIVNRILGEEKQLVADFAGLTRESSEAYFEFENRKIKIIDTPGLRRRSRANDVLEKISASSSVNSYKNADIVVLLIDASSLQNGKIEKQDLTLASNIIKNGKVLIIAFNKYDKAPYGKDDTPEFLKRNFSKSLSQLKDVPFLFISALDGTNVVKMLKMAFAVYEIQKEKIKTSDLNNWLLELNATDLLQSGSAKFKLKYITQIKTTPPTFIIFVSNKSKIRVDHERFIINRLKKDFSMNSITINVFFREQKDHNRKLRKFSKS
ncbi:MAG: ribosome biogenesis GTPase Der [Holosporales bacterium]|jgi:GTP-binding protein|nr:ribosome biogenesis GTPase Der [Holosporales bacterium]